MNGPQMLASAEYSDNAIDVLFVSYMVVVGVLRNVERMRSASAGPTPRA